MKQSDFTQKEYDLIDAYCCKLWDVTADFALSLPDEYSGSEGEFIDALLGAFIIGMLKSLAAGGNVMETITSFTSKINDVSRKLYGSH